MNRSDEGLFGDVDPAVTDVAGRLTPVPGGVGPMTIALLLENAVRASRFRSGEVDFPFLIGYRVRVRSQFDGSVPGPSFHCTRFIAPREEHSWLRAP